MEVFITYKVGRCRIPEWCDIRGYKLVQVADAVGISKQTLNHYINSRRHIPSIERARNIAEFLKVDPIDLYEWEWVSDTKTEE
ncbi:helix-turn-helix transcriptional regulator [Bacillus paralicheniformis]|uniref:helix-turn-helix domain-containing protein n=1 Tax=Bacillus TaxID=1386 RepID=UPI0013EF0A10|nr:helix-turn-helix transcriptional regulator [Bacillus paralicheniformis]